jgi:hypothetical protein
MRPDPRIIAFLAELIPEWADQLAALGGRQHDGADRRDLARDALRDMEICGLRLVLVANDQPARVLP